MSEESWLSIWWKKKILPLLKIYFALNGIWLNTPDLLLICQLYVVTLLVVSALYYWVIVMSAFLCWMTIMSAFLLLNDYNVTYVLNDYSVSFVLLNVVMSALHCWMIMSDLHLYTLLLAIINQLISQIRLSFILSCNFQVNSCVIYLWNSDCICDCDCTILRYR